MICAPSNARRGSMNQRRACSRRGFSLVELIMVAGIIATLGAIALPRYGRALERYRLEAAARIVAGELRLAAARAHATSQRHEVRIRHGFGQGNTGPDATPALRRWRIDLEPARATFAPQAEGGAEAIAFNGYGRPEASASFILAAGNLRVRVGVTAEAGVIVGGVTSLGTTGIIVDEDTIRLDGTLPRGSLTPTGP